MIIYVVDSGAFFVQETKPDEKVFISFEEKNRLNEVIGELPELTPVKVVFDLIEEEIEFESVPKIFPWERSKTLELLLARKMSSRILMMAHKWVPLEKDGDKQLFVRLVEILSAAPLRDLLYALEGRNLLITHIFSTSLLAENYLPRFNLPRAARPHAKKDPFLLVLRRDDTSYRQLFFQNGVLMLSRIVEVPEGFDQDGILNLMVRECDITIKFLYNDKVVNYGKPISIHIAESTAAGIPPEAIERALNEELVMRSDWTKGGYTLTASTLDALCPRCSKKQAILSAFDLFIAMVATHAPGGTHFVTDHLKVARMGAVVKKGLIATSIATLLIGSYYGGTLASEYYFTQETIDYLKRQSVQLQRIKKTLIAKINSPYDARDLKAIVEFSDNFSKDLANKTVPPLIDALARQVDANPDLALAKLRIQRTQSRGQLIGGQFIVDADFVLTQPAVLYQDSIERIQRFAQTLKPENGFKGVALTQLPIQLNPKRQQGVTPDMLMPASLMFKMKWTWEAPKP